MLGITSIGNPFSGTWRAPWSPKPKAPAANGMNFQATGSPVIGGSNLTQASGGLTPTYIENYTKRTTPYVAPAGSPATSYGPYQDPRVLAQQGYEKLFGAEQAVNFARLADDRDELEARLSAVNAAQGARSGSAGAGAALANRGVDLDFEKLGIDRAATERQNPFLDMMLKLRTGQRGSDNDYLKKQTGFVNEDAAQRLFGAGETRDRGMFDANEAKTRGLFDVGENKKRSTRDQLSDAVAGGAMVTQGNRDRLGDIETDYNTGVGRINTDYAEGVRRTTSDFDMSSKAIGLARDREQAGIKARWDDNYWQQELDNAGTAEEKAKIQDRLGMLDITAKELGLKREQIANSLAQTLASMGLDDIMTVGGIMDALNGNDQKAADMAADIAARAWAAAQSS